MKRPMPVLVGALLISACGGSTQGYTPDTSTDGWFDVDGAGDVPVDTLIDTPTDGIPDGVPDTWTDTTPDTYVDPMPDTAIDPTPDWYPDTATDTYVDTAVDTSVDIPVDGTTRGTGESCYSAAQCTGVPGSGRTCLTTLMGMIEFPGGYCSATCTSAADCGTSGACVSLYGYGSYCLRTCASATTCRTSEGYTCSSIPSVSGTYCIPPMSATDSGPVDP